MTEQAVVTAAYVIASTCVVYKLAFLVRQVALLDDIFVMAFRLFAAFGGTVIIFRMVQLAEGHKDVEWFDVATQIGWCCILYFIIVVVGRRRKVW